MTRDNDTAVTHLSRLGVNPVTIAALRGQADALGVTLRELVLDVLSEEAHGNGPEPDGYRVGDGGTILPTSR